MVNAYGLSRGMADAIVAAVRHDPQCAEVMPKVSAFKFFTPARHAGTARNALNNAAANLAAVEGRAFRALGFQKAGKVIEDYWDVIGSKEACTGIAAITAKALSRVRGQRGYEFLIDAGAIDRMPTHLAHDFHTATAVTVEGNRVYVFDWHSTLDLGNPLIFQSSDAFQADGPCSKYTQFWGWA